MMPKIISVMSTVIRRIVIARAKPETIRHSGVFRIASQARNDVKIAFPVILSTVEPWGEASLWLTRFFDSATLHSE